MKTHLTAAAKAAIVSKALNREDETLAQIAKAHNVGLSSLSKWLRRSRDGKAQNNAPGAAKRVLTSATKLEHIIATANLDEVSLGTYCRKHGIYNHQVTGWRSEIMSKQGQDDKKLKAENIQQKKKIQTLERELNRKEKALAEASALLVLKKKPT